MGGDARPRKSRPKKKKKKQYTGEDSERPKNGEKDSLVARKKGKLLRSSKYSGIHQVVYGQGGVPKNRGERTRKLSMRGVKNLAFAENCFPALESAVGRLEEEGEGIWRMGMCHNKRKKKKPGDESSPLNAKCSPYVVSGPNRGQIEKESTGG